MKITVDKNTAPLHAENKTDIQLQDEALQRDKQLSIDTERDIIRKNSDLAASLCEPQPEEELTANILKQALGGTYDERIKEEKTIYLTLSYGQKPNVVFGGFWNGKLVNNAMNAISRAYRVQRHKTIRANVGQPN